MLIEPGQTLLHYRLVEKIGEGGMGVVWKARDTGLDRDVAIKVLPAELAADPDRLARLEREARLLASLDHPNVAAVFGLHEAPPPGGDGPAVRFIAMELVDGETCADRLERGALPVGDALDVCRQIADAIESAHERGVVHRDLKPANVKIRPDGTVKVLDFGLARAVSADALDGSDSASPTVLAGTRPGAVLGTAPYMSPEQARGRSVDRRTDVWALGCVLYECLAGRRPFDGETATDVLARIVTSEPDFDRLPPGTPPPIARLIRRCLEKDARRRLRDAGELRVAIETWQADPGAVEDAPPRVPRGATSLAGAAPWILVALLGALLAYAWLAGSAREPVASAAVSRWSVALPAGSRVALASPGGGFDYSRTVAISRDGERVAFSVRLGEDRSQLFLKAGDPRALPIDGTVNARGPFFSPDGAWLGYYDTDDNGLYKVPLAGGSPQKLFDLERTVSFDATWAPDGSTIVIATDDGLWRLPAGGGALDQLTAPDADAGEVGHHFPRFTRDGSGVLFTVSKSGETDVSRLDLESGEWGTVIPNASSATPVGADRVVIARAGELLTARYDAANSRVSGAFTPVLQGLQTTPGLGGVVLTQFDVSDTGTLAYVPAPSADPPDRLLWVGLDGTESPVVEGPGTWVHPRLSPDGTRVSIDIHSADGMRDVYVYELGRGQLRQLTRTGMTWESEWSPDGRWIALLSAAPAGLWSLFRVPTDFSGPPELLHRTKHAIPAGWTPDGSSLLYSEWVEGGIWSLEPEGEREPSLIMQTEAREGFPRLSPDGRWIAYVETDSGRREVFVQSFPALGAKHRVSVDGGREAVWSRDGRRLFYRSGDGMYAVDVSYGDGIRLGRPRLLFSGEYDSAEVGHQHYDISLESDRFLMVRHGEPDGPHEVRVVLNWHEELAGR